MLEKPRLLNTVIGQSTSEGLDFASNAINGGTAPIVVGQSNFVTRSTGIPSSLVINAQGADPILDRPTWNGGLTRTMSPLPGSPLLGAGSGVGAASFADLTIDQNRVARNNPPSIGAVEGFSEQTYVVTDASDTLNRFGTICDIDLEHGTNVCAPGVTLRDVLQAIETGEPSGNAAAGRNVNHITFAPRLSNTTLTLNNNLRTASPLIPDIYGKTAFTISSFVTIDGVDAPGLVISGDHATRLFEVTSEGNLTLSNLTLADGVSQGEIGHGNGGGGAGMGGAIRVDGGRLTADRVTFRDNQANGGGGGIDLDSNNNAVNRDGGGTGRIRAIGDFGVGGLTNGNGPALGGNGGFGGGGAGAVFWSGGVGGNGGFGGGQGAGPDSGRGGYGGGNLPDDVINIGGGGAGMGGAVFANGGIVDLSNTTFANNQAIGGQDAFGGSPALLRKGKGLGGAVFMRNVYINRCLFENNHSDGDGGAIVNVGVLTVENSTFNNNTAAFGGAISSPSDSSQLTLINSTLVGNTADFGGALENFGTANLFNSTVAYNKSNFGGGIHTDGFLGPNAVTKLTNTILGGNTNLSGSTPNDFYGSIMLLPSSRNNLIGPGGAGGLTTGINGNVVVDSMASLEIGALADNGGPLPTIALNAGSPAINSGDQALLPSDVNDLDEDGDSLEPLPFDQRGSGFARVVNGGLDMGAFEVSQAPAVIGNPSVSTVTENLNVDSTVSVGGSGRLTAIGTIPISDDNPGEANFRTIGHRRSF